jgi:hypothetical protein
MAGVKRKKRLKDNTQSRQKGRLVQRAQKTDTCADDLAWFMDTHVPDADRGYAVMNPLGAEDKYIRKTVPLTNAVLRAALGGKQRRLEIYGSWQGFPLSIAVVPEHHDHWGRQAVIDVDADGEAAVRRVLAVCAAHRLWAYVQLGESAGEEGEGHQGGHVRIPFFGAIPSSLLHDLAVRIMRAAEVQGDAFPYLTHPQDLRLPLMAHLRAPGGPRRFPLLLPSGERIDSTDPWEALHLLRTVWQENSLEALTAAIEALPPVPVAHRQPMPRSKVYIKKHENVIGWYNKRHDLRDLLANLGVRGTGRSHVVRCPWHDDRSPSLAIWCHHETEQWVCRCFSTQSNCPAAARPYLDAFNIYCLEEGLTGADAVKRVSGDYRLGQRRTFKIGPGRSAEGLGPSIQDKTLNPQSSALSAQHSALITSLRSTLNTALAQAAQQRGQLTVIRATPGLGKTERAAAQATRLHIQGLRVAIVVPNHQVANDEWAPRLPSAYIWRSRADLCTCYDRDRLRELGEFGYRLPSCRPGCPYAEQARLAEDRIVIYQQSYLHLWDGRWLAGADVIIIDESPLDALLEERRTAARDVASLISRLEAEVPSDPALPLLTALGMVARDMPIQPQSLRGRALIDALQAALPARVKLPDVVAAAQHSQVVTTRPRAPLNDSHPLEHQFLAGLLGALIHDLAHPGGNTLLAWARVAGESRWSWYQRHTLLQQCLEKPVDQQPAVIVLDGSADRQICERLYAPWPIDFVQIDAPIAPTVEIIQCPITASTRRIVQDRTQLWRLGRQVAATCYALGVVLDGGVSYQRARETLREQLGGEWLYYGNLRGVNVLKDVQVLALVASATMPPDAIARKAMALWLDDDPIDCMWEQIGRGTYHARDTRLAAMDQLHGPEELRQAAMRCRPILSSEPTTLLVFSPWDLEALGLSPQRTITELPHGKSKEMQTAWDAYQLARQRRDVQRATQVSEAVPEIVATPASPFPVPSAHATASDSTPAPGLTDVPLRVGRAFLLARKRVSPYALT